MCIAIQEMKKEEKDNILLETIKNVMKNLKMTAEQAMDAMGISADDQKRFLQML